MEDMPTLKEADMKGHAGAWTEHMVTCHKLFVVPDRSRPRRIIDTWHQDYNTVRSHSALGYLTPEEFEPLSRKVRAKNAMQSHKEEQKIDASRRQASLGGLEAS